MDLIPARELFICNLVGNDYLEYTGAGRVAWTYETKQFTTILFENYLHGFKKLRAKLYAKLATHDDLMKEYNSEYLKKL